MMIRNQAIATHFHKLSAHSDVAAEMLKVLKRLGEYEVRTNPASEAGAVYCVTNEMVFCAASGMVDTFWRLRPRDVETAIASGACPTDLGPDWVKFILFRNDWPEPDLMFWSLRAYDFARTGK